jgi:hypothetical protein
MKASQLESYLTGWTATKKSLMTCSSKTINAAKPRIPSRKVTLGVDTWFDIFEKLVID